MAENSRAGTVGRNTGCSALLGTLCYPIPVRLRSWLQSTEYLHPDCGHQGIPPEPKEQTRHPELKPCWVLVDS